MNWLPIRGIARRNMKKLITGILLFCTLSNVARADCDWSQIKKNNDNTYTYSQELNICVGNLVRDDAAKDISIADLNKVISQQNIALSKADARTQLWMDTSFKLEDKLNAVDSIYKKNEWLYFALGVVVTSAAVYGASKLAHP